MSDGFPLVFTSPALMHSPRALLSAATRSSSKHFPFNPTISSIPSTFAIPTIGVVPFPKIQAKATLAIVHPLLSAISLTREIVFLSTSDESTAKKAEPSYFFMPFGLEFVSLAGRRVKCLGASGAQGIIPMPVARQ